MTALIDLYPDAFDDDVPVTTAPVPTPRPAAPTPPESSAAPTTALPMGGGCAHATVPLPDPLPDTVLAALSEPLPVREDKWQGLTRLVGRCMVVGLTVDQTCAVAHLDGPATRYAHGRASAVLCQLVRDRWDEVDPAALPRTDVGNAARLALAHGADIAWSADAGGWFQWDGTRWTADGGGAGVQGHAKALANTMLKHAKRRASSKNLDEDQQKAAKAELGWATQTGNLSRIKAMVELARSEPGVTVPADVWDRRPELLAVANGTVELRRDRARLRPADRLDRLTRSTATPYKPGATGPLWTAFLERAVPDPEVRRFLQKLAGYSMYGGNPARLLIFLIGPTSTGKTTFGQVVLGALGEHAGPFALSLFRAKRDEAPRPDLVTAMPKRFLFTSEASDRWQLHADEVKNLVGADSRTVRTLHSRTFVTGRPAFTPWVATNAAPTVLDADQALFRRLLAVPFLVTTSKDEEDDTLGARIREQEADAVLSWLVQGWDMYVAEGLDDVPAACVEASMQLRSELSVLDRWLTEECEQGPEYSAPVDLLFRAFCNWCADARVEPAERGNRIVFGKNLTGREFGTAKEGGKRVRTGLRLTSEAMQRLTHATEAAERGDDPEHGGGFSIGD